MFSTELGMNIAMKKKFCVFDKCHGQGHSQGQTQYHHCGALKKLCLHMCQFLSKWIHYISQQKTFLISFKKSYVSFFCFFFNGEKFTLPTFQISLKKFYVSFFCIFFNGKKSHFLYTCIHECILCK